MIKKRLKAVSSFLKKCPDPVLRFMLVVAPVLFLFRDPWANGWLALTSCASLYFLLRPEVSDSFVIRLAIAWGIFSSMWVWSFNFVYAEYAGNTAASLSVMALRSGFVLLLFCVLSESLKKNLDYIENVFGFACVVDSLIVLSQAYRGVYPGGLLGNASMNGCFIAMAYCFVAFKEKLPVKRDFKWIRRLNEFGRLKTICYWIKRFLRVVCVVVPPVSIFFTESSVPVGVLSVVLASYVILMKRKQSALGILAGVFMGTIILVTAGVVGHSAIPSFEFDSGRFTIWKASMDWWQHMANPWIGTGLGTFFLFGPHIQVVLNIGQGTWWWALHNDWLQILFETGFIGLIIYLALFWTVLRAAIRKNKIYIATGILGFGATMVFNFPCHVAATALLGLVLILRSQE